MPPTTDPLDDVVRRAAADSGQPFSPTVAEVRVLTEGLYRAFLDVAAFDRLNQHPALQDRLSDGLPADLRTRILNAGLDALTPHEVVQLAVTPRWQAELWDELDAPTEFWVDLIERRHAAAGGEPLADHPAVALLTAAARTALRRAVRGEPPVPVKTPRHLVDAVADRLWGQPAGPADPAQRGVFYAAVAEEMRRLLRKLADRELARERPDPADHPDGRPMAGVVEPANAHSHVRLDPAAVVARDDQWLALRDADPAAAAACALCWFAGRDAAEAAQLLGVPADEVWEHLTVAAHPRPVTAG